MSFMIFKQKSRHYKTVLDFGENELIYKINNLVNTVEHKIPYDHIHFSDPIHWERKGFIGVNIFAMFIGMIFVPMCILAFIDSVLHPLPKSKIIDYYFYLMGIYSLLCICLKKFWYEKEYYTIYSATDAPDVYVRHDHQKQAITNALKSNWRKSIKEKYGQFDLYEPPIEQLQKFQHLRKIDAIDEKEYEHIFNQIRDRIREKNISINHEEDPELEMDKFVWMHDNQMISDEEFINIKRQLNQPST
jgi:hypothetical protein